MDGNSADHRLDKLPIDLSEIAKDHRKQVKFLDSAISIFNLKFAKIHLGLITW